MARSAFLSNLEKQGVSVTIYVYFIDSLAISGFLALEPQSLPASAVIMHPARLKGFQQSFAVHVGKHDYPPFHILHNGSHEPFVIKLHL